MDKKEALELVKEHGREKIRYYILVLMEKENFSKKLINNKRFQ